MIYQFSDYRSYLRASLSQRIQKNPAYSLRAFAKGLGLSPTMLSLVQNGRRNLAPLQAMSIAKKLGLKKREADYFALLVQLESAKTEAAKALVQERLREFCAPRKVNDLALDAFKVISEWYHFPILQMLKVKNVRFSPNSIAERLGIGVWEAETALSRLVNLGILKRHGENYQRVSGDLRVNSKRRSDALRGFHRQMLLKAIESLQTQTPDEKYVGSETIAVDVRRLPEAKKLIDEFFDQMDALLEGGQPTEVYHLAVQFFRLTKGGGN